MPQAFFDQLAAAQQRYVTFEQQQHQPNQVAGDTDHDHAADTSDLEDESLDEDQDDEEPLDDIAGDEPEPEPAPRGAQISEALKAERRKTNNLERDLRTLKRQLSQFSKINPDEYERLQEAERQKEQLEREIATRERQLEASAARKVKLVAKERDEALKQVDELRKDRLLERLFIDAEGRTGGDNRGSFFEIFRSQVGAEFRLSKDANGRDILEPIDSKGSTILGDDGTLAASEHVESLRTHPVLSFLFSQRGGLGPNTVIAEFDGNGQTTNLQSMTTSELYLASYGPKPAGARR
ncbi:hypothetical protein KQ302_03610 [Synechococcus sp. CS-602]|uniref:hypothetical protein n=2 Tax=Synechococcales TaxID=1890424 RepID=UPI0011A05714|nr:MULTISPECIES: hypothetical protein [Synechococcaceae]MCT0204206.1 hypothetical protein [Synechococcus sp. CS-602]MCT4364383.1 hypothetical protein [Candidatus Regnicoccus frigidus MAG-AL1]MCT4366906.1 hypothetical protein [Candidatus Regnicoccus frigidus MAG-AL2]TWB86856.1 hypothetical protein FB106_1316 [Synechococcus sp. Ace-Pa]